MDHQLNNPLRPSTKTPRSETTGRAPESPSVKIPTVDPQPLDKRPLETKSVLMAGTSRTAPPLDLQPDIAPEVKRALDAINAPEDLRNLLVQLSKNGIELAGPKKIYVKHSYEIDQE